MKRSVLFVVGLFFVFCTNVMAADQPAATGKTAPAQKSDEIKKVNKGREIEVIIKSGSKSVQETVICQQDSGGKMPGECKKKNDSSALTQEDINAMVLQKYFPEKHPNFSDLLNQTKHSYTNQSGPQTFHCDDLCTTVCKPVKNTIRTKCGIENGLPIYCIEVIIENECTDKCTHSCECIAGCY